MILTTGWQKVRPSCGNPESGGVGISLTRPSMEMRFPNESPAASTSHVANSSRPHWPRAQLQQCRSSLGERCSGAGRPGDTRGAAIPDVLFAELDEFVVTRMAELKIPGVAIGVIAGDREHAAGFGVTNVDHPLPVDADTLFQIGSTTKTFTGTAIMRLVEQGKLDLEAPVRTYLPDFRVADPEVSEEVRLRHLVTHTAGWYGDDFTETGDGDDALARYVAGMADLPQIAPLGKYFSYNNGAVCLAGRVIEVVTGQTYEAAVAELVLTPLGLAQPPSSPRRS